MNRGKAISFVFLFALQIVAYFLFAFHLKRENFSELVALYVVLYGAFFYLVLKDHENSKLMLYVGIFFRLIFLFSLPSLSQDFYRFIWDGRLLSQGINPYLHLPDEIINNPAINISQKNILYGGMGSLSSGHYTNYPPLNQIFFAIAVFFGGKSLLGSVVVLKIFVLLADVGTYFFAKKILLRLDLPQSKAFYYFLNPFVIVELSGNLHFEGVMVFFLAVALYFLLTKNLISSAIAFSAAILTKLLPVLLLPILLRYLKIKQTAKYYIAIGVTVLLFFIPFVSGSFFGNYGNTLSLWFTKFEFNASFYYLLRQAGYLITGYNQIHFIGPALSIFTAVIILIMASLSQNTSHNGLLRGMLLAYCSYLFFSTTVHPWYITVPLFLSLFTKFRFVYVWAVASMFSYYAYSLQPFKENMLLLMFEYILVFGVLIWELKNT